MPPLYEQRSNLISQNVSLILRWLALLPTEEQRYVIESMVRRFSLPNCAPCASTSPPKSPRRRPPMSDAKHLKLHGYPALLADHCELADAVAALTARVAKLEAQHETRSYTASTATPGQKYNLITDIAATLASEQPLLTHEARTATPGQTYTWLPGDAWSQYCEAQP